MSYDSYVQDRVASSEFRERWEAELLKPVARPMLVLNVYLESATEASPEKIEGLSPAEDMPTVVEQPLVF